MANEPNNQPYQQNPYAQPYPQAPAAVPPRAAAAQQAQAQYDQARTQGAWVPTGDPQNPWRWDPTAQAPYNPGYPAGAPQYQQPGGYGYVYGTTSQKSKLVAGLLAIFLGAFGIHKFYLGYTGTGIAMLLITLLTLGLGAVVMEIIGIIEGVLYLTKDDAAFYYTYVANEKKWF